MQTEVFTLDKVRVCIHTIEDARTFTDICGKFDFDINLYEGSIGIDAKSFLGVCSLALGDNLFVQAITPDEREAQAFMDEIRAFIV